jgi:hypothetical protein
LPTVFDKCDTDFAGKIFIPKSKLYGIFIFESTIMKKILAIFLLSSCFTTVWAQTSPQTTPVKQPDVLRLKESSFDFGKIPQGRPVTHIFQVFNNGNESLVLENVQASCGCTTPEWSKDPISPGGSQKITVGYNSASEGSFEKSITITYNKGQTKIIMIKGIVWKTPDQSAPKNNSLAILKNIN